MKKWGNRVERRVVFALEYYLIQPFFHYWKIWNS